LRIYIPLIGIFIYFTDSVQVLNILRLNNSVCTNIPFAILDVNESINDELKKQALLHSFM
ncbi:hypothetical protein T03_1821, partial [Trichinella britovi]